MKRTTPLTLTLLITVASAAAIASPASAINVRDFNNRDAINHETYLRSGGNPQTSCLGKAVTIVGSSTSVTGTSGDDVIVSLHSNAVVNGGNGDDVICAYNVGAEVYGGNGDDVLWSDGNARQRLLGSDGHDVLLAFQGSGSWPAALNGGAGADRIYGGPASETIVGHDGTDRIFAGGGNDIVYGGLGPDLIFGQAGNDALYGEAGNDLLCGASGRDTFFLGASGDFADYVNGTDTLVWPGAPGTYTQRSC